MKVKVFQYQSGTTGFCSFPIENFWIPTMEWIDRVVEQGNGKVKTTGEAMNLIISNTLNPAERIPYLAYYAFLLQQSPIKHVTKRGFERSFKASLEPEIFENGFRLGGIAELDNQFYHCKEYKLNISRDLSFLTIYKEVVGNPKFEKMVSDIFDLQFPKIFDLYCLTYYTITKQELCVVEDAKP